VGSSVKWMFGAGCYRQGRRVKKNSQWFLLGVCGWIGVAGATTPADSLVYISSTTEYVEVLPSEGVVLDLRYATTNNFMGVNLYGEFNRAFLHRDAAIKLNRASELLAKSRPGYKLLIFDALRPRSVQQLLWDRVKGTAQQPYVANPVSGSIHNFGFAVDLSIVDEAGNGLDMGTPFDAFEKLAQPRLEAQFLKEGKLTEMQLQNRLLLRNIMTEAGFIQLPLEWWHFDALPKREVKQQYTIVE